MNGIKPCKSAANIGADLNATASDGLEVNVAEYHPGQDEKEIHAIDAVLVGKPEAADVAGARDSQIAIVPEKRHRAGGYSSKRIKVF